MNNLPTISPTTLNGYTTVGIAACVALLEVPGLPKQYAIAIGGVLAFLRILTGHQQKDAGSQLADVPGASAPQIVPSHEVPDMKGAVPVAEAAFPPSVKSS